MATHGIATSAGSRETKPVYDIARAESIFGWMSQPELQWLAEQAHERYLLCELGSYFGRSTRALADNSSGIVWAIDRWARMDYMPNTAIGQDGEDIWREFNLNLGDHLNTGRVRAIRIDHKDVHPFALPHLRKLDMVFIDGDHEYEAVCRDIREWRPRLAPGGLLCGHDARSADWPGVDQALAELVPDAEYVPGTALWWKVVD